MKPYYIELESISSKRWMLNAVKILMIEERTSFSRDEISRMPELSNLDTCCTIILEGRDETFWVKDSYLSIKKLIDRPEYGRDEE